MYNVKVHVPIIKWSHNACFLKVLSGFNKILRLKNSKIDILGLKIFFRSKNWIFRAKKQLLGLKV